MCLFAVYEQRDAAECLDMILHNVSQQAAEVSSQQNYCVILKKQMRMMCDDRRCYAKVFKGEMTHITKCSEGHIINEETNPFWTLPLSLTDTPDTTYSVVSRQSSQFLVSVLM